MELSTRNISQAVDPKNRPTASQGYVDNTKTAQSSEPFSSVPLHHTESQIRLVELLPGQDGDGIEIGLFAIKLGESGPFEALSYVWGSREADMTVLVNGKHFNISANLAEALGCLRETNDSRVLWVDAICINQADTAEKSRQVTLMGEIYRSAQDVLIFLGAERDDSAMVLQYLNTEDAEQTQEHPPTSGTGTLESHGADQDPSRETVQRRIRTCGFDAGRFFHAVDSFFKRPWWMRMWVLQEFSLAKNDPRWYCGRHETTTANISAKLVQLFNYHNVESIPQYGNTVWSAGTLVEGSEWIAMHQLRTNITSLFRGNKLRRMSGRHLTLWGLLLLSRRRQSTDPRDRVFALREMTGAIARLVFTPDYTRTVGDIFVKLSSYVLLHEECGHVYDLFEIAGSRGAASWALDFARPFNPQGETQFMPYWTPEKASWAENWQNLSIYDGVLSTSGVEIDTLDRIVCLDEISDLEILEKYWWFEGLLHSTRPSKALPDIAQPSVPAYCLVPFSNIAENLEKAGARTMSNQFPMTFTIPGQQLACVTFLRKWFLHLMEIIKPPPCETWESGAREAAKFPPPELWVELLLAGMDGKKAPSFYGGVCFDLANLKAQITGVELSEPGMPDLAASPCPPDFGASCGDENASRYRLEYSHIKKILRGAKSQPRLDWQKKFSCDMASTYSKVASESLAQKAQVTVAQAVAAWESDMNSVCASKNSAFRGLSENCTCAEDRRKGHQSLLEAMLKTVGQFKAMADGRMVQLQQGATGNEQMEGFSRAIRRQLSNLFITRSGFFGVTFQRQSGIKEGDKVVVLDGLPAPMILGEMEGSGQYRMKAAADVMGIKQVDIEKLIEVGVWQRREFRIV